MPTKKKLLKEIEKEVVDQDKEKTELEDSEETTGKEIDPVNAPAVDTMEEMKKEWKYEETGREVGEANTYTNEGMDVEEKERTGEDPYPETEESIKKEADEDEKD